MVRLEREKREKQERALIENEILKKEIEELRRINSNNDEKINTLGYERDQFKSQNVCNFSL